MKSTIWLKEKLLFPDTGSAPPPNSDLPRSVIELYEEASSIAGRSRRAAAALLRLAVQVLCKELGEKGKDLNEDIASLVSKGLPATVQQSLDTVRVIGNHAVHPGQIDVDDPQVVGTLFKLLNLISELMITQPKAVKEMYDSLPAGALKKIDERDGPTAGGS